jgi:histidinol phosphatase-like PHP family hydrolase
MIDYDLHIHTEYCGHAPSMTVEAILERAEAMGLSTLAITDHIFKQADHAIIQQIRDDVVAYAPSIKVYVGAEVDVNPDYADGRLVTEDLDGLDIVIAGFHYVPTVGNLPHGPQDNSLDDEVFMEVWASSLLGVVSNPKIHTLAHPGRLLAASMDLEVHFEDALCVFEKAAVLSAKNKIAWELNELSGYRLGPYWLDQWHRIYEIALSAGVKLVYGSDSHTLDTVGKHCFVDTLLQKLPKECLAKSEGIIGF